MNKLRYTASYIKDMAEMMWAVPLFLMLAFGPCALVAWGVVKFVGWVL